MVGGCARATPSASCRAPWRVKSVALVRCSRLESRHVRTRSFRSFLVGPCSKANILVIAGIRNRSCVTSWVPEFTRVALTSNYPTQVTQPGAEHRRDCSGQNRQPSSLITIYGALVPHEVDQDGDRLGNIFELFQFQSEGTGLGRGFVRHHAYPRASDPVASPGWRLSIIFFNIAIPRSAS